MSKMKLLSSILLAFALVTLQVGAAFAAPAQQTVTPTTITGNVDSVVVTTDANGTTIVQVTLTDANNVQQTYDLSVTTAAQLGLIQTDANGNPVLDANGQPVVNDSILNTQISFPSTDVLTGGTTDDTPVNPVAGLIADFFGLSSSDVMAWHEDGNGFGVIAQSCFIAAQLGKTCTDVLAAKHGDFSLLGLPEGTDVTNWGQLKKYAFGLAVGQGVDKVDKSMQNLGAIVSGRATGNPSIEEPTTEPPTDLTDQTHGKGNGKNNGHGKGGGNGKGH